MTCHTERSLQQRGQYLEDDDVNQRAQLTGVDRLLLRRGRAQPPFACSRSGRACSTTDPSGQSSVRRRPAPGVTGTRFHPLRNLPCRSGDRAWSRRRGEGRQRSGRHRPAPRLNEGERTEVPARIDHIRCQNPPTRLKTSARITKPERCTRGHSPGLRQTDWMWVNHLSARRAREMGVASATPRSPFLEDLTWTEVRDALQAGATTVIIPGRRQRSRAARIWRWASTMRASRCWPAGSPTRSATRWSRRCWPTCRKAPSHRPQGTCAFPARSRSPTPPSRTCSTPPAAASQAGRLYAIVLIGDHGGYQGLLRDVAAQLNREWADRLPRARISSKILSCDRRRPMWKPCARRG